MLKREDFIFTIGYDGPVAIVDSQAKRQFGALSTADLAEKGLFRAAYASALYSGDPNQLDIVINAYNGKAGTTLSRSSALGRLFGVFSADAKRCKYL